MRHRSRGIVVLAGLAALGVAACGGGEATKDQVEAEGEMGKADRTEVSEQAPAPDTTAAALWTHLQETDYRSGWRMWPDKGELYAGGEPHGMLLTTYLNTAAHDALTGPDSLLPPGAVVVKENYKPDSTLAAVTVMYKHDGYDADHNDWFWVKYDPDGTVANDGKAAGRVPGCIQCHGGAADNDYIMTGSVGGS